MEWRGLGAVQGGVEGTGGCAGTPVISSPCQRLVLKAGQVGVNTRLDSSDRDGAARGRREGAERGERGWDLGRDMSRTG